jgi:hypothetical protein
MNKNIALLIGATIGAGVGYLIADWYIEFQMPTEEDEEDFELNEFDVSDRGDKFQPKPRVKKEKHRKPNPSLNYTEYFQSQNRPELAVLAAKYNGQSDATPIGQVTNIEEIYDDSGKIDEVEFIVNIDSDKDPVIISIAEYANDGEYDHQTLHYFDDDVVTDEDDLPINRPEKFLGDEALVSFGVLSEDEDIIYVRNNAKKAMYEILRLNKNYAAPRIEKVTKRRLKEEVVNDKETGNT